MKLSIHFGINKYDSNYYGKTPNLNGCVNDSLAMKEIAKQHGFTGDIYNDEVCTTATFTRKLNEAAKTCQPGDIFLFTNSSHGTYQDINGKRITGICLHDQIIWDFEIGQLLSLFQKDVLIIFISDSCFSEDNYKRIFDNGLKAKFICSKAIDCEVKALPVKANIKADIINYASSTDHQPSYDGPANGIFTGCLKQAILRNPDLNYYKIFKATEYLMSKTGYYQTPKFAVLDNSKKPFTYNKFLEYNL